MNLATEFRNVRRTGTPLVAIATNNANDTLRTLRPLTDVDDVSLFVWDNVRGLRGVNDGAKNLIALLFNPETNPIESTVACVNALEVFADLTNQSVVIFLLNAHHEQTLSDPFTRTAICNLRDPFKREGSTLVLLGPDFEMPDELILDVVRLRDPLPDEAKLNAIVDAAIESIQTNEPKYAFNETQRGPIVGALRGLSSFGAEQQLFLSLRRVDGALTIDVDSLMQRKIENVNSIDGLTMRYDGPLNDGSRVRGIEGLQTEIQQTFRAENPRRPNLIVHLDEFEKMMSGSSTSGGDTSGVSQDMFGALLTAMQDNNADGCICCGGAGTGKSFFAETLARVVGVPYVRFDMNACQDSLVGASGRKMRRALETLFALADGRVFFVATCNDDEALKPELKRRFKSGIWLFELPDRETRSALLRQYAAKYNVEISDDDVDTISKQQLTGAEIRNLCDAMEQRGVDALTATDGIVPTFKSERARIATLRQRADGCWKDARTGRAFDVNNGTKATTTDDDANARRVSL